MDRYVKLDEYIAACRNTPFGWGKHDCCIFASLGVQVQTGRDPMADLPLYSDEAGARAVVEANGGLESMVTQRLGAPIAKALARRGDVVMADTGNGPALGICLGSRFAVLTEDGLRFPPMRAASLVWRVE